MGDVAMNAIPKGVANVAETPLSMGRLVMKGLASLPGAGHLDWLQQAANEPELQARPVLDAATQAGLHDPAKNPQTPEQRVVDAMVQGSIGMAVPGGIVKNMATGAAAGGAGQMTKELTGSDAAGALVGMATPFAVRRLANPAAKAAHAVRDQTLREGQKAGYVVPASEVNPSFVQNRLESVAGKAAIKQEAVGRNQAVTNALTAKELGLPRNTPLTESVLNRVRKDAARPYDEIAQLSPTAKDALKELKQARFDANEQWRYYHRSGNPDAGQKARQLSQDVQTYEQIIEQEARQAGRPELVKALGEGRTRIAKTYDVEKALNLGSGDVSAPILGRQLDQAGEAAKSGNLATTGRFQQAFPKFMGEGATSPTPGVSAVEPLSMAGLGMGGAVLGHSGWLAGGLPLVRGPVRSMLLSPAYQRFFAQPNYSGLSPQERVIQSLLAGRTQAGLQENP
jgi:hypothetical protein